MKTFLTVMLLAVSHQAYADTPPTSIKPISSTERWADRCTDFTTNGAAFKSPRVFLQWIDVVTDPAIWLEYGNRSLDPQSYVRTMSSLIDPGMPKNWLEFSNPEIYAEWGHAAGEPDFYTALSATLLDPGRYMRWAMLPLDNRTWSLMGKAINPQTWFKWMAAPVDTKTQALFAKALDVQNASLWLEAWVNPENNAWLGSAAKQNVY